jgi:membrane glycosyltransferase
VLGAALMVVVMVLVVPVALMFGGAIWSALFGWASSDDADRQHGDAA